jgi:hypothetical protein
VTWRLHGVERARRLDESKPEIEVQVLGNGQRRLLRMTLVSDESLTALDVFIRPRQGVSFAPRGVGDRYR